MQLTRKTLFRKPFFSKRSHWWLVGPEEQIIDLNVGPEDPPSDWPYEEGQSRGFMMLGYWA